MAEPKKKNWWDYLMELYNNQPLRYQGTYLAKEFYNKPVQYQAPVTYNPENVPVMFNPDGTPVNPMNKTVSQVEQTQVPEGQRDNPVQRDMQELSDAEKFNRFYFNDQTQANNPAEQTTTDQPAGGVDPYGTKKKGFEDYKIRGNPGEDIWWYDMSRAYDQWGPELQASWAQTYGKPYKGAPYQVYPYWKHDNPTWMTGGSYKGNMFGRGRAPSQPTKPDRGMIRNPDGPGWVPGPTGEGAAPLADNAVGNQMVTWRR